MLATLLPVLLFAAPGDLDRTFNGTGRVVTPFASSFAFAMALQGDGKIVVVGRADEDFAVVRYLTNGTLDLTFNGTGQVIVDFGGGFDYAKAVVIQGDGKILVAGNSGSDFAFARFLSNGGLDPDFGVGGKVTHSFSSEVPELLEGAALQSDGKIIAAGTIFNGTAFRMIVVRLEANGDRDASFGFLGANVDPFAGHASGNAVRVLADDRILVAGSADGTGGTDFAVARFNAGGTLDTTFGGGTGGATLALSDRADVAFDLAVQPDGRILLAGNSNDTSSFDRFAVGRFLATGAVDPSFGTGGAVTTDIGPSQDRASGVAVQADGKILLAGEAGFTATSQFALVRYLSDGRLDSSFGRNGVVTTDFGSITGNCMGLAIQPDGRIVGAGALSSPESLPFALARYKVAQGDMRLGATRALDGGDNRYNLSGLGQTQSLRIPAGRARDHFFGVQNDSSRSDRFALSATSGNTRISAVYRIGRANVTAAITTGRFRSGVAAPGDILRVTPMFRALGTRAHRLAFKITARSLTDADARDRAIVNVVSGAR